MNTKTSRFMKEFQTKANLSEKEARRIKDALVQALRLATREGRVVIQGLGTFEMRYMKAKKARVAFLETRDPLNQTIEKQYRNVPGQHYLAFKAAKCNRKYDSDQLELLDIDLAS